MSDRGAVLGLKVIAVLSFVLGTVGAWSSGGASVVIMYPVAWLVWKAAAES